jgi:5-methylthioadenosine/S-adenosylhomocysteine deaminase
MSVRKAYDFLEMATIKAAQSVGLGAQVGSLEVGKRADVILVDFDQAHISPMNRHYDLVTNLVYNAHGSDVTTVLVDGRVVIESGEIRTVDEGQALEEANKRAEVVLTKEFGAVGAAKRVRA